MPHEKIGRYNIIELLGQGGMGKVYRALDPDLNREVVLKLINLPDAAIYEEWRQRFRREVQAAGQLNHPHIVTVYDVNLEHYPPYVVMELLHGVTLRDHLKTAPLLWRETLLLLQPLVEALAYAHRVGVVHRDVKPTNIMFGGDSGRVLKLVDFGLARGQSDSQVTHAGTVIGTLGYMSPEQAQGDVVDARTDIFAVGVILFEAIAGYNPLNKDSIISTMRETLSEKELDLTPLIDKAVPPQVISLVKRAVTKNRDRRYPTCEELLIDLRRCLNDSSVGSGEVVSAYSTLSAVGGPEIRVAAGIELNNEVKTVLRRMFATFRHIAVEAEFGGGFGGSRVLRVRPVENEGKTHLPAVVKIAPIGLIRQEWEAYQTWVKDMLPNTARLDAPLLPSDGLWGGLRYALVGAGSFEVKSLRDYYQTATIEDLSWVLEKRLFEIMGPHWWWDSHADRTFQLQTDYDSLLPINLLFKPVDSAFESEPQVVGIDSFATTPVVRGDQIRLNGFMVTRVDLNRQEVTLNLPPQSAQRALDSFRVRLVEVSNIEQYRVGNLLDSVLGQVVATRHDLLSELASQALGTSLDLGVEQLPRSGFSFTDLPVLPNPLLVYQNILQEFMTVKIAKIHGDLNMANILIDPETREVNLIDFATVRQGHALHDLLRLETEVIIMLLPATFVEAGLPAAAIHPFYEQLHQVTLTSNLVVTPRLPAAELEKPFELLRVIRKMARTCLFNMNDWREYYQGLTLYLLGALKFDSLDLMSTAPLPKQLAFLGAATIQALLNVVPRQAAMSGKSRVYKPARKRDPSSEIEPPFGAMRPTSRMYIRRVADDYCLSHMNQSYATTLFIKASRQMGKTSLMHRALYQAGQEHHRVSAFVDFQEFPKQHFDQEQDFLMEFCGSISNDLGLPPAVDQYWRGAQTDSLKCRAYMAEYIMPAVNAPLILALDELDRVLTSPFRDNFFGMLRAWHNYRARDERFAKLSLLLSSSTEPYLFIDNPNQSPFNVAEVIALEDFTRAEVDELNQRHRLPLTPAQVDDLMDLVDGHPFLTRLALYQVATGKIKWQQLLAQATAENGPFGDHLRRYLALINQKPELKQAMLEICRSQTCPDEQIFHRLKGAGLIKRAGQQIVLRNKLYTRYFKECLDG